MTAQILIALEKALKEKNDDKELKLHQVFDMIVGTSTGNIYNYLFVYYTLCHNDLNI